MSTCKCNNNIHMHVHVTCTCMCSQMSCAGFFLPCFFAGFPLDDGGSDIIYYQVEKSDGSSGEGAWQTVATVHDPQRFGGEDPPTPQSSLTHSVSHLSPGETYHFRVTSHNSIGVSTCTMYNTCTCACTCTMYIHIHLYM